jgi:hypothetical protein
MYKYNAGIIERRRPGKRNAEGIEESGVAHIYAACDLNEE